MCIIADSVFCCLFSGWLYDYTNSYAVSFYIGGGATILSAFVLISIPIIQRNDKTVRERSIIIETHYDGKSGTRTLIGSTASIFSRSCHMSTLSVTNSRHREMASSTSLANKDLELSQQLYPVVQVHSPDINKEVTNNYDVG